MIINRGEIKINYYNPSYKHQNFLNQRKVKHDREYVAPNKNNKLTKQDYLANIWYPIFSHLFKSSDANFKIRLKVERKHYPNDPDVRGFKIDIRIIVDAEDEECDISAAELVKQSNFKKIINAEVKLSREGKDVIDYLTKLPITNLCPMSWLIQIANCQ
ncbi:hypothetical protein BDC45DRAFT_529681 [Circinella umbellata]|nr:hypothetical protein BDC45DRAFT_529681 [Circinella umbellata]